MLTIFLSALGITALALKFVAVFAPQLRLLDRPDADHKTHEYPKPIAGVALGVGTLGAWWIWLGSNFTLLLGLGALGMMLVGLDDDRHPRSAAWRLLAQFAIATAFVVASDSTFRSISAFGFLFSLGWLAIPFTVLWLVTLTNAFNLIDGSDGLSAGVALLLAANFFAFAQDPQMRHISLALLASGGLFWWFNKPPAKLFLGDGGAYFLGFVLAAFSLYTSFDSLAGKTFSSLGMGVLFFVPLGDVLYAIFRRLGQGRSVFSADDQHVHHHLERALGSWPMLLILYGVTLLSAWMYWMHGDWWR